MPTYQTDISKSAKRSLDNLPPDARDRLVEIIQEIATHRQPSTHPKCDLLNGTNNLYKVRTGEYRAIGLLDKPAFRIVKVGNRNSVYQDIEEIHGMV